MQHPSFFFLLSAEESNDGGDSSTCDHLRDYKVTQRCERGMSQTLLSQHNLNNTEVHTCSLSGINHPAGTEQIKTKNTYSGLEIWFYINL